MHGGPNSASGCPSHLQLQAEVSAHVGADSLCRLAVLPHSLCHGVVSDNAEGMRIQVEQQRKAAETLTSATRALEAKLAECKGKKDTLRARAMAAAASREIGDMLAGLDAGRSAMSAFNRMEEKVVALEAQADSALQMLPAADDVEMRFLALEGGISRSDVDDELVKMKIDMAGKSKPYMENFEGGRATINVRVQ